MQDIITYMQQLGVAQEFYSKDIKLLLTGVTEHFLWHSEYPFQESDLDLQSYISKVFKKALYAIHKELYWVFQNWHGKMAYMMYLMYFKR